MDDFPIENPAVAAAFNSFPKEIRKRLLELRKLILSAGNRLDPIGKVEESIKWGEPSYSTIRGSSVRLGWNKKDPDTFGIYFHCQTKLVSTYRVLYPKLFSFEGNRAIIFHRNDRIPVKELKHCIELAHSYHRRKNKPLLAAEEIE